MKYLIPFAFVITFHCWTLRAFGPDLDGPEVSGSSIDESEVIGLGVDETGTSSPDVKEPDTSEAGVEDLGVNDPEADEGCACEDDANEPTIEERPYNEALPMLANFSKVELVGITAVTLAGATLAFTQDALVAHMGPPKIGDPGPLDVAISDALYRGPGADKWLGGLPDLLGQKLAPALSVGYYGVEGAVAAIRGRSLTGDVHAVHEFLAFAEAYGTTLTLTYTTKLLVGRERPYSALEREPTVPVDEETYLSFFSGHTSSSFCLAAFVTRDVTDWLVREPLADRSTAQQVLLGRIVPGVIIYGAAGTVGLSRIIDQGHYFTDVFVGALVGGTLGNLFYALHFDGKGRPGDRRDGGRVEAHFWAGPTNVGVTGRFY